MTVAAFMELALYHPEFGYYASRRQRSGRAGDFYTSVDVGPVFGELLAVQIAEMARAIGGRLDLVEAAAGNGRLTRDVLDALEREAPDVYAGTRVHLVERSAPARAAQRDTLGPHAGSKLQSSGTELPPSVSGILFANELLDALPVHIVVMRADGAREIFVDAEGDRLIERELPLSSAALADAVAMGPAIPEGVRIEVGLESLRWMRSAADALTRGFVLLADYGDDAPALRSRARPGGTLRAFAAHRVGGAWLDVPGTQDLTAHVDFTALTAAAARSGLQLIGRIDQARFLLGLGAIDRLERDAGRLSAREGLRRRLALKSLLVPGGIGSTHSVLIFGKNMDRPALAGLSLLR